MIARKLGFVRRVGNECRTRSRTLSDMDTELDGARVRVDAALALKGRAEACAPSERSEAGRLIAQVHTELRIGQVLAYIAIGEHLADIAEQLYTDRMRRDGLTEQEAREYREPPFNLMDERYGVGGAK